MKRIVLVMVWCCVALALSCSRSRGGTEGSDTNWLRMCDDDSDCGTLSCLCGVCTVACEAESDCSGASPALTCRNASSVPSCADDPAPPAMLCERECAPGESCTLEDAAAPPAATSPPGDTSDPPGRDGLGRNDAGTLPTLCGDGVLDEGEACDDGNRVAFDDCSERCRIEPQCDGATCTTRCGDGLVVDEECDDGNTNDGDGCSSTCEREEGFECRLEPVCNESAGVCTLTMSAVYRDFPNYHPDFATPCSTEAEVPAWIAPQLDARGFPALAEAWESGAGCITSENSFAEWYDDDAAITSVRTSMTLYLEENPDPKLGPFGGGYFNRFGPSGERFQYVSAPGGILDYETTLDECRRTCAANVCDAACSWQDIVTAQASVDAAEARGADDEELEPLLEALDLAHSARDACLASCPDTSAAELAECRALDSVESCLDGRVRAENGSPLFFPLDDVFTPDAQPAKILEDGDPVAPWEDDFFGTPGNVHNFSFTSEFRFWGVYDPDDVPYFGVNSDHQAWAFINGRVLIDSSDLGDFDYNKEGVTDATQFDLEPGQLFELSIFLAQRKTPTSSLYMHVGGMVPKSSVCTPTN